MTVGVEVQEVHENWDNTAAIVNVNHLIVDMLVVVVVISPNFRNGGQHTKSGYQIWNSERGWKIYELHVRMKVGITSGYVGSIPTRCG